MTRQIYDPAFVKPVFDRCSGKYIAFSCLCSFGFTERWRRQCVAALPQPPGPSGYDLMAGTGDASGFAEMLRKAGLEVRFDRYFFGCATGVSGRKPEGLSAT